MSTLKFLCSIPHQNTILCILMAAIVAGRKSRKTCGALNVRNDSNLYYSRALSVARNHCKQKSRILNVTKHIDLLSWPATSESHKEEICEKSYFYFEKYSFLCTTLFCIRGDNTYDFIAIFTLLLSLFSRQRCFIANCAAIHFFQPRFLRSSRIDYFLNQEMQNTRICL